jgi:hypothetical protein
MRRWSKRILGFLVVALVLIQFVPVKRSNPPIDPARSLEARAPVPAPVKAILDRSCADCHSNRTHWPWYTGIAPASWLVISDVNEGRRALNLSDWAADDPRRQANTLKETCDEATEGEMPPWQYVIIHRQASLSQAEIAALCQWTRDTAMKLGLPAPTSPGKEGRSPAP